MRKPSQWWWNSHQFITCTSLVSENFSFFLRWSGNPISLHMSHQCSHVKISHTIPLISLLMAQNFKSLIRSHALTSPAHLSPNILVLCAPAALSFSDFFSGVFSLSSSQGEHMYSPHFPCNQCFGQGMLSIESPCKCYSQSTLNFVWAEV